MNEGGELLRTRGLGAARILGVLGVLALGCGAGSSGDDEPPWMKDVPAGVPTLQKEIVHLTVDQAVLAGDDAYAIIEPVVLTAEIYGSAEEYERSLASFSTEQRQLLAVHWYQAEVHNGGHDQFFFNSTGIVTDDALAGLKAIGAAELHAALEEAVRRLGGAPKDRAQRQAKLEASGAKFGDLDDVLFLGDHDLDGKMVAYARAHADAFAFDGKVEREVVRLVDPNEAAPTTP